MITRTQIKDQMECFGYEVFIDEEVDDQMMCFKEGAPPLLIELNEQYINFYAQYSINYIARSNKAGFLNYINRLNGLSTSANVFLIDNAEHISFGNKYFGIYDRRMFSEFIRYWEYDVIDLLNNDHETEMFLGSSSEFLHDDKQTSAWA